MNQDDRLGPYRLLRRLGEGGMGVVHLAVDPNGRQVAVKVLRSEVAGDDTARKRLSREVQTMRRVRSPNIAEVLDADVTGRRPYIVTRYVPGRPLDEIVKQDGPLSLDALLKVGGGVAEALVAVHAAGVVHRDLKPGNVLMLDGRPVLIDFGISQAVDATRLTQTGMFIGTPGYLAPEIIEGHEAGPEVDVHAWAGTLLFAATGQPPFGKGTLEMIFYNITSGRANVGAAPEPLQPLLRAALQRDPAKRPTAAELVDWIARLATDRPQVPDEVATVPNVNDAGGRPVPGPATPPQQQGRPAPPAQPAGEEFVSLLTDAPHAGGAQPPHFGHGQRGVRGPANLAANIDTPVFRSPAGSAGAALPAPPHPPGQLVPPGQSAQAAAQAGDPFPTVRVTGDDLRQAGIGPSHPVRAQPVPPAEGDIPTRRVTAEELRQIAPQAFHGQTMKRFDQTPEIVKGAEDVFERTPHVHQPPPAPFLPTVRVPPPSGSPSQPAPSPYQPPIQQPLIQQPFGPSAQQLPAGVTRHATAYGVAAALLFALMMCLAVIAPVLVCVLALPVAMLLRTVDIAHPEPSSGKPAASATDAIVRSIGVTIALIPYGLILGLSVTVLLALLIPAPLTALSWGIAVAVWAVCAGPGVEGPRRQLRRTLASLVPGEGAARGMTWGIGAAAAAVALVALASLVGQQTAGHFWGPVDVDPIVQRLAELRNHMGNQ